MALEAETKKVVSQFELPDHDVNAATLEFLRQMGKFFAGPAPDHACLRIEFLLRPDLLQTRASGKMVQV